jgi:hypothetical protein
MLLHVKDRLLLLGILGKAEGNLITLRVIRDLQREVSFSEEESKALSFKSEGNAIQWDAAGDAGKEFEIGDLARKAITDIFKGIEEHGQLTMAHLPLYEMFLPADVK